MDQEQTSNTSAEPVRSRWSPKPEQIQMLESIFKSGMVNPPKEETIRIRKMLEKFGKVGDANVFYWFQNRRSRLRRRQRQLQAEAAAAAATTTNTCDETMMVSNSLPSDLGFGGCSTSSNNLFGGSSQSFFFFSSLFSLIFLLVEAPTSTSSSASSSSSSSYGGGFDNQSNSGMESLLTMSGQMDYHDHNYQQHSSHVASLFPSDQNSNFHYQQEAITVFVNGVPTEVMRGGINMKTMFGEDLVLVHPSGVPLPTDEFGFLMHTLQHGDAYFLVMRWNPNCGSKTDMNWFYSQS